MEEKKEETKTELTLLLLFLTGWEEESRKDPGEILFRSWKGYPFALLNKLQRSGLIEQYAKSKSVILTPDGIQIAEELKEKYLHHLEEKSNKKPSGSNKKGAPK